MVTIPVSALNQLLSCNIANSCLPYLHWTEPILNGLRGISVVVISRIVVPHFTRIAVKRDRHYYFRNNEKHH